MRKLFTEEQLAFIKENIPGRSYAEMAELINARFGTYVTASQVCSMANNAGWSNGRAIRYQVGHKGYQTVTSFQKGHASKRRAPIGTERIKTGYVKVKTTSTEWKSKHVVIWESIHGPVPAKHTVVFGDGDKRNFAPDNLVLIPLKAMPFMVKQGLIGGSAELTRTGLAVAELCMAIANRKKGAAKRGADDYGQLDGREKVVHSKGG